ncbi:uncharacterized protein STEHIDRAFT_111228 [Stereum hirsutum FP-91666 SS1]|uniref:uncharacterized protein n=1 Tax=Stereum hirsutum (strain FP-91666) TaxID=721885 RepID=UPI0004449F2C|nr:uncharacterized protein STEHIDRAFT_111228 [Stereum hirsutum FP-91666 SS1]EIM86802.1 hypothetical protein STEHIDRAFT_111228 [Stereum hirsutum FP-91666 SS1]
MMDDSSFASPSAPVRDAPPPFNDPDGDADIIIRSVDGIDFRVHRLFLSKASHAFRDMFTTPLPQPSTPGSSNPDSTRDGLPIIPVTENEKSLSILFQMIYPMDMPNLTDLPTLRLAMRTMDKYIVPCFSRTVESALAENLPKHPHAICALAARYSLTKIANEAAMRTLRNAMSLSDIDPAEDDDWAHVPNSHYQYRKFLRFHQQNSEVAVGVVRGLTWADEGIIPGLIPYRPRSGVVDPAHTYGFDVPPLAGRERETRDSPECTCPKHHVAVAAPRHEWSGGHRGNPWRKRPDVSYGLPPQSPDARSSSSGSSRSNVVEVAGWFVTYLKQCETIVREKPYFGNVLEEPVLKDAFQELVGCPFCSKEGKSQLEKFAILLGAKIKNEVTKIQPPF